MPFVKNYVPPPEPTAIREDGQPTCNFISSFASHHVGVASDACPAPTAEAPADAPATAEGVPAATTEGAPAEAVPEAAAPTTEGAPSAEAAPAAATETAPAEAPAPTA